MNISAGALSALKAFGTRMASIAGNVANAQSTGYKRTDAVFNEADSGQGVKVTISRDNSPAMVDDQGTELSNVDIARELIDTIPTEHGYSANVKTVKTMDEMIGTLLDIKE